MRQTVQGKDRDEYKVLARLLRKLRKSAGLTQVQLGERIDRSQQFIGRVEQHKQLPDFVAILDIIEVTGGDAPSIIAQVQEETKRKRGKR